MSKAEARFPIFISLAGWAFLFGYLYYYYIQYQRDFISMLLHPHDYFDTLTNVLFFIAPLMSTTIGYIINHRIELKQERTTLESHYRDLAAADLRKLLDSLIVAFANALDAKSPWTKGHSLRVTDYALAIAMELGLEENKLESIRVGALLHDIGKLGTYDSILDKVEKLTDTEFELIKMHPARGVRILAPISHLEGILPIVRHHHERVDGKGYPDGLKGNAIPQEARIVCCADSFDAMISERPYKKSLTMEQAIKQLQKSAGAQFDPLVVNTFVRILEDLPCYKRLWKSASKA